MPQDPKLTSRDAQGQVPVQPAKKPYVKPALRRLGSVRELTKTNPSNGK